MIRRTKRQLLDELLKCYDELEDAYRKLAAVLGVVAEVLSRGDEELDKAFDVLSGKIEDEGDVGYGEMDLAEVICDVFLAATGKSLHDEPEPAAA